MGKCGNDEVCEQLCNHAWQEIRQAWPSEWEPPSNSSLWRWLELAIGQGLVHQMGAGRRQEPFRYWLAEQTGGER